MRGPARSATLTGFAGRSFQFNGEPGAHYVLVAGAEHQVRPLRAPAVLTISEIHRTAAPPL
jgi:hypothetical protein